MIIWYYLVWLHCAPQQVEMSSLLSGMAAAQEADVFVGVHGEPMLRCAALWSSTLSRRALGGAAMRVAHAGMRKVQHCTAACAMSSC